jgi:hypothetical protein
MALVIKKNNRNNKHKINSQKWVKAKELKIYNGEIAASSTKTAGKTG